MDFCAPWSRCGFPQNSTGPGFLQVMARPSTAPPPEARGSPARVCPAEGVASAPPSGVARPAPRRDPAALRTAPRGSIGNARGGSPTRSADPARPSPDDARQGGPATRASNTPSYALRRDPWQAAWGKAAPPGILLSLRTIGFAQPRIKANFREIEGVPSFEVGGYTQMSASGMVRSGNRAGEKSDSPIALAARR